MIDPFDTLGIAPTFDVDLDAVEKRFRDLSRVLHPDRHVGASATQRRISLGKAVEVNEAWRLIRDPIRRAEALLKRHGVQVKEGSEPKASPEFLMEMMEHREALSEARTKRDKEAVARLAERIRAREKKAFERLSSAFGAARSEREAIERTVPLLGELRYYRRFLDEVSAIEDG
jgi:molecular chaperone HscB